ncbi:DUF1592 domain-containing protein [Sandaracinus amylolyticus]|uniref:DUF1592 domain-containing protein n=1 Tax=Sandaracinus amylolyticus TaxID=927083 RepID=UPI001F32F36D|nr:DUF1592 domain-containing protein [Sandaracinus amylolyticus]UJR78171.1 Cytochrome c domain-containing protein [Sandaracinus amylolyticus]
MTRIVLALSIAMAATGCLGVLGEPSGGPGPGPGPTPGPGTDGGIEPTSDSGPRPGPEPEPTTCGDDVGPRMVRRLTARQYQRSLEAIFESPDVPTADVLSDPVVHGFRVDATQAVIRDLGAQQVMTHAERVASWAVANRLAVITTCQTIDATCRDQFVRSLGARVFREPLSDTQLSAYAALFDSESTFPAAAELVIAAMLQSPYFLYRREIGTPETAGRHRLTPHELASELAYLLTDAPPDSTLRAAADAGQLATPDDLARELDRILATPAAADTMGEFAMGWLEIADLPSRAKDDAVFMLTPALRASMLGETRTLFLHVLREGGTLRELLTADYTFVDAPLRAHYGITEGGGGGGEFQRVTLPAVRAPGVLGHASVLTRHALAATSSPVARGHLVRERFLCEDLPAPPPGVPTDSVRTPGTTTTRQRYLEHSANETCAACHRLMDPIGFSLEHYDAFGRYRADENGMPIDVTGVVHGAPGGDVPLDGAESLIDWLADSAQARSCFTHYLSYYSYGIEGCDDVVVDESAPLRDVLAAIVRANHFRERTD